MKLRAIRNPVADKRIQSQIVCGHVNSHVCLYDAIFKLVAEDWAKNINKQTFLFFFGTHQTNNYRNYFGCFSSSNVTPETELRKWGFKMWSHIIFLKRCDKDNLECVENWFNNPHRIGGARGSAIGTGVEMKLRKCISDAPTHQHKKRIFRNIILQILFRVAQRQATNHSAFVCLCASHFHFSIWFMF